MAAGVRGLQPIAATASAFRHCPQHALVPLPGTDQHSHQVEHNAVMVHSERLLHSRGGEKDSRGLGFMTTTTAPLIFPLEGSGPSPLPW